MRLKSRQTQQAELRQRPGRADLSYKTIPE
nr:MAG TPA: hypothetical protein [Caudoviricetes sp.]